MTKKTIKVKVNGKYYESEVKGNTTLLDYLRNHLSLTGTKEGCGSGDCGACSVIVEGKAVNSCLYLAIDADKKEVMTIEGLKANGELHPLQRAFIDEGAVQCGFCTPGMLMSAKALLDENPSPDETEIRHSMAGNLCRCTGYERITKAVFHAAQEISGRKLK